LTRASTQAPAHGRPACTRGRPCYVYGMPLVYLPLVSVALYALVRLLKDDTILPDVAPVWRARIAWALGLAAGVVDLVLGGSPWHAAAFAVLAPALAQTGHEVGIEVLREGRELPIPKVLRKRSRRRLSGRFPSSLLVLAFLAGGCGGIPQVPAGVAAVVDPVLRVAGFCRDHAPAEKVDKIVDAYMNGDQVGAILDLALLLDDLREAGVPVPREVYADHVRAVAAVEGLQRGLRALDNRDAQGRKLPDAPDMPPEGDGGA
jgi:hypothetical protein